MMALTMTPGRRAIDRMAASKPGEIDRFVRNAHERAEFMDEDYSSWEEEPTCDA
jgi:hypothetical protein